MDHSQHQPSRRGVLKTGVALAGVSALGAPALLHAQTGPIKIGHLTPLTGFLGALGDYAVQGIKMAVEEINAGGGVLGRQIDLLSEDSVNPQVASSKAQRMIERDGVALLMRRDQFGLGADHLSGGGAQQEAVPEHRRPQRRAARQGLQPLYLPRRHPGHGDGQGRGPGAAARQDGAGQEGLQPDLGLPLRPRPGACGAKKPSIAANGASSVGDELVATDLTDFSPFLLKIRQARPDLVSTNLGGNQVTNFVKQYAEFGLPYPVVGFNLNTADAWAAGEGNLGGTWPTVWHHELDTPGTKAFVAAFQKKYNRIAREPCLDRICLDEDPGAGDHRDQGCRHRQADRLFRERGAVRPAEGAQGPFPPLGPPADAGGLPLHRQAQGAGQAQAGLPGKFGAAVPGPNEPLELLAPTQAENACKMG
jgi:branched-chain amino acid transport system substrate-binding protein